MRMKKDKGFEPKIIGFLCNWCSYAAADKAGAFRMTYPDNVLFIRVMCTGRIDPQMILDAYKKGADGVIIMACLPGECHYKHGNTIATRRHRLLVRLLDQFGVEEDRCRFDYVSSGEGEKFVRIVEETVRTVRRLGPLEKSRSRGGAACRSLPSKQGA